MSSNFRTLNPPQMTDVLEAQHRDISTTFNCIQIGEIVAFYPDTHTADVQIVLKKVKEVLPDGKRVVEEYSVLKTVPVMILFGGVGYLTMAIEPGDNCILLFNDREYDEWFANGGVQTPQSYRQHDLSDALAIVGIKNMQNSIANFLTNGIRMAYGENSKIDLTATGINTIADLFLHTGNLKVAGNLEATGEVSGAIVTAGNGASGTFNIVTVENGIVTGGS